MNCLSCGGKLGVDCFNPEECAEITRDMELRAAGCPECGQFLHDGDCRQLVTGPCRDALKVVMQLIDDGLLVRDTSRDSEPDWAMRQLPLICALQKARAALEAENG